MDGTPVLVFNGENRGRYTAELQIGVASWQQCMREMEWVSTACCDGVTSFRPTHWQPLPEPPGDGGGL